MKKPIPFLGHRTAALLVLAFAGYTLLWGQALPGDLAQKMHYRSIGPTRQSGRFVDFAVVAENPKVFYVANASGGLWKTENKGTTFFPVFDNESVISIGDVAVDQQNPETVWVGTGEANNSRTAYYGDGIYRSDNGGKSWTHMGLKESHHIGRILIHPENSDVLWVAAAGKLYSENEERGLYKTTNGGKSWKKVLSVKDHGKHIGVIDVAMDPSNPDILYAAAYDKVRKPWTFNPGGPGSGIYKSVDGGKKWEKLTNGLPGGMLGRIGLDVSVSNPNVVYANIENCNVPGVSDEQRYQELLNGIPESGKMIGDEMYRSDDKGKTWRKVSPDGEDVGGGPAYYYQQVRIDPTDPDHVYVLGVRMWETIDGGKNWRRPFNFGGDNHAMWINPADPKHIMLGYDHGLGISYDAGKNWQHPDNLPVGQFVAVGFDMEYPYNVYGGLQDNGSKKGPSTKRDGGPITMEDWITTGGGDGMYNEVDPTDSRWLYNESQFGPLSRTNQETGERTSIRYRKMDRFAWNAPIVISPHNPKTIYHAGNKVVKSPNRGETWTEVSPDLTDQDSLKIRGTGNIQYNTIVTLAESPVQEGVLWAGTDCGNVWVTQDGGSNWDNCKNRLPGYPGYWISRVEASRTYAGRAYVTSTGYRRDDFRPFVWKTEDYGKTWKSITANLPADESVCVIREHPRNPNLLFLGTTKRIFVSMDGGQNWASLQGNMPVSPVEDLKIHPRENDLIVGTHGRSMYIGDISWLEEMTPGVLSMKGFLFTPENKVQWGYEPRPNSSSANYAGESEPLAVPFYYYVGEGASEVQIELYEGALKLMSWKGKTEPGLHQQNWNYQRIVREKNNREMANVERMIKRYMDYGLSEEEAIEYAGGDNRFYVTAPVGPGTYTVKMKVDGKEMQRKFTVLKDHWAGK